MIITLSDRMIDTTQVSYMVKVLNSNSKDFQLDLIISGKKHDLWFLKEEIREDLYDKICKAKEYEAITNLALIDAVQGIHAILKTGEFK